MKISFSKEEYFILNRALWARIKMKDLVDKHPLIKKSLTETIHLICQEEVENGKIVTLTKNDLLNILDSLLYFLEEINYLIIGNRSEGYPTDIYETDKHELIVLYEKVMLLRVTP